MELSKISRALYTVCMYIYIYEVWYCINLVIFLRFGDVSPNIRVECVKYSKYFLVYHPNLVEDTAGEDVGRGRGGGRARGRNFLVYHRDLVGVTCGCVRKRRMRIRRENNGKKGEAELKGWREDGGGKGGMERGREEVCTTCVLSSCMLHGSFNHKFSDLIQCTATPTHMHTSTRSQTTRAFPWQGGEGTNGGGESNQWGCCWQHPGHTSVGKMFICTVSILYSRYNYNRYVNLCIILFSSYWKVYKRDEETKLWVCVH